MLGYCVLPVLSKCRLSMHQSLRKEEDPHHLRSLSVSTLRGRRRGRLEDLRRRGIGYNGRKLAIFSGIRYTSYDVDIFRLFEGKNKWADRAISALAYGIKSKDGGIIAIVS